MNIGGPGWDDFGLFMARFYLMGMFFFGGIFGLAVSSNFSLKFKHIFLALLLPLILLVTYSYIHVTNTKNTEPDAFLPILFGADFFLGFSVTCLVRALKNKK